MSQSKKKPENVIPLRNTKTKTVCKAFECQEEATTKGFCRLHFIMKLKGSTSLYGSEGDLKKNDRRRSHRLHLQQDPTDVESLERAPEEIVQTLTEIEGQTPTSIIDIDDLNPLKKTGSD